MHRDYTEEDLALPVKALPFWQKKEKERLPQKETLHLSSLGNELALAHYFSSHFFICLISGSWALMICSANLRISGSLPYFNSISAILIAPA